MSVQSLYTAATGMESLQSKLNVIAIEVDEITGRQFELTRPWLHMRPSGSDPSG